MLTEGFPQKTWPGQSKTTAELTPIDMCCTLVWWNVRPHFNTKCQEFFREGHTYTICFTKEYNSKKNINLLQKQN